MCRRIPSLIESDDGLEFVIKLFTNVSRNNNNKRCSRNITLEAVVPKRYNRTLKGLLLKSVFQRGDVTWFDMLPTKTTLKNYIIQPKEQQSKILWKRLKN